MELSGRQKELLRIIIEKYIDSAKPVGSETIEKETGLGVSPATIRNEMVHLTSMGYLKQPHTSAGRVPTTMAIKFYVSELMKEKELSVKDEVTLKQSVWDHKNQIDDLLRDVTRQLADRTHSLALATSHGQVFSAGLANILDQPEFYDIDLTKTVLSMIDKFEMLNSIFGKALSDEPIHILLGDEFGYDYMEPCGVVFSNFDAGNGHSGYIGVIGSNRLNYSYINPVIRYVSNLLNEISKSW